MSRASWEGVAHILEREDVSDADLAARLGCDPLFITRVRADLRQPPFSTERPLPAGPPSGSRMTAEQARFERLSMASDGGHRVWLGRCVKDGGTPLFNERVTAGRVAFRMQHGREPEGHVHVECELPHCVEGLHLSDGRMRAEARRAAP